MSTQPEVQVNPWAEALAASTTDTSPPPAPGGKVIAFPAPKVEPQHQIVMLHLMKGPLSRVHAWVEPGALLGTYTTTTLPTFGEAAVEPGDGQRFVFHVPSAKRLINHPFDCEADARRAIANVVRVAEWVELNLDSPDTAELNRRMTAAQLKHSSRAQAIKNVFSFGVLPHALAEQDAVARGKAQAVSAPPAASPPPPPPPPPPGGKGSLSPTASPTSSPKRLEPTSYGLGQGAPPAPPAPSSKKPAKGRGGKAPVKIPQAPVPSAKVQQRPSTIAPVPSTPAASAALTPPKKGRVSAASAARGKLIPAPIPAPSPSAPTKPTAVTAPKASTPAPAALDIEQPKAARVAPRTVKTSTFYPLTPASQHPDYTPKPLDPKTPPAGLSAKARASGIPELGGWEQKREDRYHLSSHQLDLVRVAGGWWWAKTGGPPISIGTGYPFSSPTQSLSCLQRRYLNRLGWKSGPWSAFAASKGLT